MFVPTAIATQLAADTVAGRRGAATHRLTIANPFAFVGRAVTARRPPRAACVSC